MLTVPYVPTLGPVHPDSLSLELFEAVIGVAGTGRFLPYDKDQRWARSKQEMVLVDGVVHEPHQTVIPTLAGQGGGIVKVHCYAAQEPDMGALLELAEQLRAEYDAAAGRVIWFHGPVSCPPADASCTRILLKVFAGEQQHARQRVQDLRACTEPVRATFAAFAQTLAAEGFGFLRERFEAGHVQGPILVAVSGQRVVGVIGPMEIMPDSAGVSRLLPQYLGVLPEHRGRGYGRALWREAIRWGQTHQAAYQLLQVAVGGASEQMCMTEGLFSLGFVATAQVAPGACRREL